MNHGCAVGLLSLISAILPLPGMGQEAAFYAGAQAMRYEEAPGVFHYVLPCRQAPEDAAASAAGVEPAICWPVRVVRLRMVQGKLDKSAAVQGTLAVSQHRVRFTPMLPQDGPLYANFPPEDVRFQHTPGTLFAGLTAANTGYQFVLTNICFHCKSGDNPPQGDPQKQGQVEAEFALVAESLKSFDRAHDELMRLASLIRIGVTPHNQPADTDAPGAMALYSELNQALAPLCSEAAQSCVLHYVAYQACKAKGLSETCGPPPSCSAFCPLTTDQFHTLKGQICEARAEDSATIAPDWSTFTNRVAAGQASPLVPEFAPLDPGERAQNACTPRGQYWAARMSALFARSPDPPAPNPADQSPDGRPPRVSGAVIAGLLVTRVTPVYPPAAQAAHLGGIVILRAIISKQGDIKTLDAISGPDLLKPAALDAVRQWKYKPFMIAGKPVDVDTTIAVNFSFTPSAIGADLPVSTPQPQ